MKLTGQIPVRFKSKVVRLCLWVLCFTWEGYQPIRKTPFLEDQFVSLSLASLLRPVRLGRPNQEQKVPAGITRKVIEARKNPPPRQGGDNRGSEVIRKELEISGIQDVRLKYKQNWINHLERMDNTRLLKHALNYKPRGRRDLGRFRKRWQCVDAETGQTT